jgi:hypothetical protein
MTDWESNLGLWNPLALDLQAFPGRMLSSALGD